eukprot:TRINITY_DN812_c0_g6_i1.p1 TRINITY_DN812_c0_g6~~TRINITY_DN812_c0_g6_i1.p1  ORF type:complete len:728 (-),score=309.74 TRINITY_DN812_c0_g6_i1:185-2368(-)
MATGLEQWKQKVREKSASILKNVQKILGFVKDGTFDKLSEVSGSTAKYASSLIDLVTDEVSDSDPQGKSLMDSVKEAKTSLLEVIRTISAVTASPNDDNKEKLKSGCKGVAERIKKLNDLINAFQGEERKPAVANTPASTTETKPVNEVLLKKVEELKSEGKKAVEALRDVEQAVQTQDQSRLVSAARVLSGMSQLLITVARDNNLATLGDSFKDKVLQVINKAKDAFKTKTPEMQTALSEATKNTEEVLNSVVTGLENAARGTTPSSPASSSPASSPVPTPKSTVISSGNNTNTAPKPDSPAPVKKEGMPKTKRPPTPGEPLSSRDSIKMLQQEFSSRDPEEVFEVMEKLGEGASGAVYKATHKETKRLLAIKKMKVGLNNVSATVKEIKIMKDLNCPWALKYYGCYRKEEFIWIIMEYADAGSVQDILDEREDQEKVLNEEQIASIAQQVLKALQYLHSMKKIHRDIKAGNILLNSKGMAKLADFGISAQMVGDEKRTTTIGSSYWMAPETLMGGGYDSRADIWSLGITLLEMAEGIPPLIEEQPHKAVFRIVNDPPPRLSNPKAWSPEFNDFIANCLVKNPEKRPTSDIMLKHPFLEKAKVEAVMELLKNKIKEKKKKKEKKLDIEEGFCVRVNFDKENKNVVVPSHATAEDIVKRCQEMFNYTKAASDYNLYLLPDDTAKSKEVRKLDRYDIAFKLVDSKKKKKEDKKKKPDEMMPLLHLQIK